MSADYKQVIRAAIRDGAESPDELDVSECREVAACIIRAGRRRGRRIYLREPELRDRALDILSEALSAQGGIREGFALDFLAQFVSGCETMARGYIEGAWDECEQDIATQAREETEANRADEFAYSYGRVPG